MITPIYKKIHSLKEKIFNSQDLSRLSKELKDLERKITLFHAKVVNDFQFEEDPLIGFHGQTIYHNSNEKISIQLGDAKLLYQLIKKKIIFNFRKNDIKNGGEELLNTNFSSTYRNTNKYQNASLYFEHWWYF